MKHKQMEMKLKRKRGREGIVMSPGTDGCTESYGNGIKNLLFAKEKEIF